MLELNRVHNLDAREGVKELDDESIDCTITSPPYHGLRDYGLEPQIWGGDSACQHLWNIEKKVWHGDRGKGTHKEVYTDLSEQSSVHSFCTRCGAWRGSLGLEPRIDLYIDHLVGIFDLIKPKLKKTGTMFINLGDSYSNSSQAGGGDPTIGKRNIGGDYPKRSTSGVIPKSLCLIPFRFAIAMTDRGWICRNVIIWRKCNCMPSSAKDRFTVDFEYMFFFTKSKKYWFEQQKDESIWQPGSREDVKRGGFNGKYDNGDFPGSFRAIRAERNKRCVWDIPTKPQNFEYCHACDSLFVGKERGRIKRVTVIEDGKEKTLRVCPNCQSTEGWVAHFAMFPDTLVEPVIASSCPPNGLILDPFAGAGTVGIVAGRQDKNFIGIELNAEYTRLSQKRLDREKTPLFVGASL